jgi:hypothetical protein
MLSLEEPRIPSECLHRLTARFFINLRAIAHHQRESTFEGNGLSFEPPSFRTPTLHKQPGRLSTNNFVRVELEKTVYSSGTNDGNIVLADVINLEVIDSSAHEQRK